MNLHHLESALQPFRKQAKQEWGQLPVGGFHQLESRRDSLACLLQERYGVARDEADRQINQWLACPNRARN